MGITMEYLHFQLINGVDFCITFDYFLLNCISGISLSLVPSTLHVFEQILLMGNNDNFFSLFYYYWLNFGEFDENI
jgi:hypothetical protein